MHSWYKGFEGRKVEKVKINKWRFIAYAHNVHRMYNELSKLKQTHYVLEVCYEDLLSGESEFFGKIFRFLGVPQIDPAWLSSKKVLPPPQDYITNYAVLKTSLQQYENGTMPKHVLFAARAMNHFFWRVNRLNPIPIQAKRKKQ